MSLIQKTDDHLAIVVVGTLNPAIFHPQWLARHGLVSLQEADERFELEVSHPDISRFRSDWFQLEVTQPRMVLRTNDMACADLLRDLAIGIFRVLSETPVTALGINYEAQSRVDSFEHWDKIGDLLAPKSIWSKAIQSPKHGLKKLEIESARDDDQPGCYRISVWPTTTSNFAFLFNNHLEISKDLSVSRAASVAGFIEAHWDASKDAAQSSYTNFIKALQDELTR